MSRRSLYIGRHCQLCNKGSVLATGYKILAFISDMAYECPSRPVFSVLVVGCGLSGLASALALAQAGHRVTVFERSVKLQEVISYHPI